MDTNEWILTQKMSLGHCRESFNAGSVIVEMDGYLMINGRKYNDTRDLDVLKAHNKKYPDDPWVLPNTEENARFVQGLERGEQPSQNRRRPPTDHSMPVVVSDDDTFGEVNISDTQISVINENKRKAEREAAKTGKLPIIYDQEDAEERLKRLAGKSDAASIAERAEIKAAGLPKMTVVRDDTLGAQYDSRQNPALNAGQVIPAKHIGHPKQSAQEDVPSERKFSVESIVEAAMKKYFGDVGAISEKLKMLDVISDKLKLIDTILTKIKALEQINALVKQYEDLKGVFEKLVEKLTAQSASQELPDEKKAKPLVHCVVVYVVAFCIAPPKNSVVAKLLWGITAMIFWKPYF